MHCMKTAASTNTTAKADGYHHGDLRRALMEAAFAVVRERGLDALSLREVAARVGVSHAAPYHHFSDKAALVRALGYESLRRLDEAMAAAEAAAPADPAERLVAIGVAYVVFATEAPEAFSLMTAPEMTQPHDPATIPEHGTSWERLEAAVAACVATGTLPPGDLATTAIAMWSLVHGLSDLWINSPISRLPQGSGGVRALAEQVIRGTIVPLDSCVEE
jgi:AcrR family transcriptional regulator